MKESRIWWFFYILYLIVDYARPQSILPIDFLRLGLVSTVVLAIFVVLRKCFFFTIRQVRLLWLFTALLALHVPFAFNTYYAFHAAKTMLLFMPFILSTVYLISTIERLRNLVYFFLLLMIAMTVQSFLNFGKGYGGWFCDENDLSLYITMWLPFCFFLFVAEKRVVRRVICATGLVIGILSIIVSFSRGGFVGLVVTFFFIWLFSPRKILSLCIIGLLIALMIIFGSESYWDEMATVTDTSESTARARLYSWLSALEMFGDYPLGVGGNNFQARFPDYQRERFSRGMWGRVSHSLWFTLIPELGIFGILIFFALMYYNFRDVLLLKKLPHQVNENIRYIHYLSLALIASMAGFFAAGTFISVLYYPHYWYMTGLIVSTIRIADSIIEKNAPILPSPGAEEQGVA
jgi:hypothetical protein